MFVSILSDRQAGFIDHVKSVPADGKEVFTLGHRGDHQCVLVLPSGWLVGVRVEGCWSRSGGI